MSVELERSYRRALCWYPRSWREKNADVVAGTLLDVADAEHRTRPRRGELANLAASGISTRLGVLLEPHARNAISTIALATGFAFPVAYFAFELWAQPRITPGSISAAYAAQGFNVLVNPGLAIAAIWALALVLALIPRQRGLKPGVVLAAFASVALILINRIPGIGPEWYGLTTTTMVFLALLGVLVLIGTPARGLRLLLCTGVIFAVFATAFTLSAFFSWNAYGDRFFWQTISSTLVVLLAIAALSAVVLGLTHHRSAAQTIAISAIPWALVVLRFVGPQNPWNTLALFGPAAALVSLGALLPLAFRREQPPQSRGKMPLM